VHQQRDLNPVVQVELGQDAGDVRLHGRDAEVEGRADLGVRLALADRDGDLPLPVVELVEPGGRLGLALVLTGRGDPGDETFGDSFPAPPPRSGGPVGSAS